MTKHHVSECQARLDFPDCVVIRDSHCQTLLKHRECTLVITTFQPCLCLISQGLPHALVYDRVKRFLWRPFNRLYESLVWLRLWIPLWRNFRQIQGLGYGRSKIKPLLEHWYARCIVCSRVFRTPRQNSESRLLWSVESRRRIDAQVMEFNSEYVWTLTLNSFMILSICLLIPCRLLLSTMLPTFRGSFSWKNNMSLVLMGIPKWYFKETPLISTEPRLSVIIMICGGLLGPDVLQLFSFLRNLELPGWRDCMKRCSPAIVSSIEVQPYWYISSSFRAISEKR